MFTNVSLNRLQKRHIHIGCICLTQFHCVFSCVLSNHLGLAQECSGWNCESGECAGPPDRWWGEHHSPATFPAAVPVSDAGKCGSPEQPQPSRGSWWCCLVNHWFHLYLWSMMQVPANFCFICRLSLLKRPHNKPLFQKNLDQSMHSLTGCTCLTFLQCAFSNESSNWTQ